MMVNVDDTSCETVPFIIEELMQKGAGSVHVVPAVTKKGRPEHIYFIDAPQDLLEELASFLACELGTIGVRVIEHKHLSFSYTMVKAWVRLADQTEPIAPPVRVKQVRGPNQEILHVKADFDDLKPTLKTLLEKGEKLSLKTLKSLLELAALSGADAALGNLVVYIEGEDKK
jgi:uncharacterized protein (DUF111 family)